jgi:tRNA-modifying protein YgfZ
MTGYEALHQSAAWIDLSPRGKIKVLGEDRARLLHAMCTNHVQALAPNHGLYAFFLNDKGRILGDANLYNLPDALFIDTEPETRAKLFEHLDRFIIADDVTLEDASDELSAIAIEGPAALNVATSLEIPFAEESLSVCGYRSGFTSRTAYTGTQGVRIFLKAGEKDGLLKQLAQADIFEASPEEARTVRIENGMPRYGEEITDRFLVQETQVMRAIHSSKGCYLGQEIVERVRSRGQVHRLLMPIQIASSNVPAVGTKVHSASGDAGEIVSAVFSPTKCQVVGMAYLRTAETQLKSPLFIAGSEPPVSVSY